jgi:hypothetical protein
MARFVRLTRADLARLTRAELLDRIEAEQQYWHRKQDRGKFTAEDRTAFAEFREIMHAACEPAAAIQDLNNRIAGVPGAGHTDRHGQVGHLEAFAVGIAAVNLHDERVHAGEPPSCRRRSGRRRGATPPSTVPIRSCWPGDY